MSQDLVDVHLFAAARAAVGAGHVQVRGATLADVITALENDHPDFRKVSPRCSFLVNERATHGDAAAVTLPPGTRIDVLPPFAGGAQ